jgi:hypothetical protein
MSTTDTLDSQRSLTIDQFCAVENISSAKYHQLQRDGFGPQELRFPGSRIVRITAGAATAGHDKFIMMDDDVTFYRRRSPDCYNLRNATKDDTDTMLQTISCLLNEVASVGISSREGNNRAGIGHALADNLVVRNTRVMRVLAYRTADFLACEHDRVRVMEDFDVQLQLLRKGLGNACLYYWANGQPKTNAPGGCSIWRAHELHEAEARRLAELHPDFVRLRQKINKTDRDGFGTRTEVTIAWKAAAKSAAALAIAAE